MKTITTFEHAAGVSRFAVDHYGQLARITFTDGTALECYPISVELLVPSLDEIVADLTVGFDEAQINDRLIDVGEIERIELVI